MADWRARAVAVVLATVAATATTNARNATTPTKPAKATAEASRFTVQGLSPALAGMTVEQADKALGQPLLPETTAAMAGLAASQPARAPASDACHYRSSARHPGVRYAVQQGRIVRSETRDGRYSTASGLKVGDTLARAQQLYGARLVLSPHPYFDKGKSLAIYSGDKKHALVMEANDDGRIITMRGGQAPQVLSLEACA